MHSETDRLLRLRQLQSNLSQLRGLIPPRPKAGWIAEFRKALWMTGTQLAKKLDIDQSSLSRLEQSEANNSITMHSLQRAAEALGCELRYILVPTEDLEKKMVERAREILLNEDRQLQHSLALEAQSTDEHQLEETIRAVMLMYQLGSKIWNDD